MKKINTSSITSTKGLIFEKKQIDFLQENTRYVTENIAYTALGAKNLNTVILWGCVPTFSTVGFSNDTLTITEGAIQYNGTIYRVDAQAVTRSVIGNTHYLEIAPVDTSENNPSTFTDSTTANTQENTKIRLAQGLSGGGIVDWVNVQRVNSLDNRNTITVIASGMSGQIVWVKEKNIVTVSSNGTITFPTGTTFANLVLPVSSLPIPYGANTQYCGGRFNGAIIRSVGVGDTGYLFFEPLNTDTECRFSFSYIAD